jgi:hypothetical protein
MEDFVNFEGIHAQMFQEVTMAMTIQSHPQQNPEDVVSPFYFGMTENENNVFHGVFTEINDENSAEAEIGQDNDGTETDDASEVGNPVESSNENSLENNNGNEDDKKSEKEMKKKLYEK